MLTKSTAYRKASAALSLYNATESDELVSRLAGKRQQPSLYSATVSQLVKKRTVILGQT
ncbi:hypothetical protein D3C84_1183190 [compost metagenome]